MAWIRVSNWKGILRFRSKNFNTPNEIHRQKSEPKFETTLKISTRYLKTFYTHWTVTDQNERASKAKWDNERKAENMLIEGKGKLRHLSLTSWMSLNGLILSSMLLNCDYYKEWVFISQNILDGKGLIRISKSLLREQPIGDWTHSFGVCTTLSPCLELKYLGLLHAVHLRDKLQGIKQISVIFLHSDFNLQWCTKEKHWGYQKQFPWASGKENF